jgi:hypothetical protein
MAIGSRPAGIALSKVRVPMPLVLGKYELLTNQELNDHIDDIQAERSRRLELGEYDDGSTA